ncbi:glycerophosphodiester phosphodiesterase [Methanolapillus millepedarum]|uniref:Uncharacterized protein n=1 Tax=Methanolapillus millepedarum TaxID=3028296 RepID=A0AA97A2Y6_9EURY|nr:hypothetical protein MsAc7_00400 [Methanosarcinaceae archaeon Ac7]
MSFNSGLITTGLKKAWAAFIENVVALIVGLLITMIGSILIVTIAPLFYGFYYMCIKATRGEKVEIKDVFYGFKSLSVFIRSWIYFIIMIVIGIVLGIVMSLLNIIPYLGPIIGLILSIILYVFLMFSIYIYIMKPNENVIYAIKESVNIAKDNFLMVLVVAIISYLLIVIGMLLIIVWLVTIPLAFAFDAYMLKELKPAIKDES